MLNPQVLTIAPVGRPLPQISVRIADVATGDTVPINEVGEILARSACVMIAYYNDPVATAETIDAEGWLHTGDLAIMDSEGYIRIAGRIKDLIIRGGENIYPREVEDVLYEHPDVIDAAVVGVPDPEWGEQVAAFVRTDRSLDQQELTAFCRERLAGFKVPRIWRFVDEFPQTASGKIRKVALAEQLT